MFIQQFEVVFGDLEYLTPEPPCYRRRGQQIIAFDAILIAMELNSNHGLILGNIV